MSTFDKWDPSAQQGDFVRTQGTFSPMLGGEGVNGGDFIGGELGDVAWQTECKIGFSNFNVYNGSEKDPMYRWVIFVCYSCLVIFFWE